MAKPRRSVCGINGSQRSCRRPYRLRVTPAIPGQQPFVGHHGHRESGPATIQRSQLARRLG